MVAKNNSNSLSGISVALGFVALGFMFAYWLTEVYGGATKYVAAFLILVGVVGFFIEIQKKITSKSFRFDNGGVGLLLLIPSTYAAYLAYNNWTGLARGAAVTVAGIVMLIGFMALIDLIISIFEELVKTDNLKGQVIGFLQFIVLIVTSAAAIFAAIKQILN